ncbi:cupredoxin superfamily protein [Artemisia annua]|uniref:Cupredoxin superfamily protein n=1 Tax=Artemisia annua TaxID=35608 RepID=A0A2U1M967_ARTAN|nr:cupredoxin superfamily protein [Artemisia annua]
MSSSTRTITTTKMTLHTLLIIALGLNAMMVKGEVYKVGGSAGWTANSDSNYSDWASSKKFYLKDVLVFEYNATTDNVVLVTHSHYRSCNTSAPIKVYDSGNDTFTIKSSRHFFFTSNFPGHCEAGQKFYARAQKSSHHVTAPPPSSTISPSPSPSGVSKTIAPSPTESSAAPTRDHKWMLMNIIGVALSGLVILANGNA